MTLERAAEILNPKHREHYDSLETVEEACRIGMQAIKKQIPAKPLETDAYPHRLYCPKCYFTFCFNKMNLDGIKALQMYNYCPDCGQALDWGQEE